VAVQPLPQAADVVTFLGRVGDPYFMVQAQQHVALVTAFVRGYTRGRGFDGEDEAEEDICAVIVTATARLVTNPAQVERESADRYATVGSFNGFTLPELAILHAYRRRTQ
jgi:hypothetical protein